MAIEVQRFVKNQRRPALWNKSRLLKPIELDEGLILEKRRAISWVDASKNEEYLSLER